MKALFLLSLLTLNIAHAAEMKAGTYSGKDSKGTAFDFHVQQVAGREGSFMGILRSKTQARIYLFDQFATGKYGMMALRPLENYVIGVVSTNPVLALTVTDDAIAVTPNHKTVDLAFDTSITFKPRSKKELKWKELISGNYESKKMFVSSIDANKEATVTSKIENLSGDYVLRETRHHLYVMLESQLNATGVKLSRNPQNIVYFQDDEMIVINGNSGFYTALDR